MGMSTLLQDKLIFEKGLTDKYPTNQYGDRYSDYTNFEEYLEHYMQECDCNTPREKLEFLYEEGILEYYTIEGKEYYVQDYPYFQFDESGEFLTTNI